MRYVFKTKPYQHQVVALKRALRQDHLGLLWEPGLGKTKTIIDWACALNLKGDLLRVLIVCPLSVVGVWEDEIKEHAPIKVSIKILSRDTEVMSFNQYRLTFLIVNYDLAWRRKDLIDEFDPEMVVADESHRIKRAGAKRSWYLRSLNDVPYRAILTGTPTPKSFLDLYGQWAFLNPDRFGTRVADFKHRYIIYGGYMNRQIRGYSNVDELKSFVKKDASIRRADQCLDLPDEIFQRVPVDLEPSARELYEQMEHELFLELEGEEVDAANVAVKILRLQQITGGFLKTDEGNIKQVSSAKLDAMRGLLEDRLEQEDRVVAFARFLPEVDAIYQMGSKFGFKTYVLRGSVRQSDRDLARREFQASPGPSLFVAQIQTGGLGITLHASHEAIFYSTTYAYDDYYQACKRIHRSGQSHTVTYRHLVARGSIDLDIYAALRRKKTIMEQIMGTPGKFKQLTERNRRI